MGAGLIENILKCFNLKILFMSSISSCPVSDLTIQIFSAKKKLTKAAKVTFLKMIGPKDLNFTCFKKIMQKVFFM